jgi:hypothetical protein
VGRPEGDAWAWPGRGFEVDIRDGTLAVSDYVSQGRSLDEAVCCPGTAVSATWRMADGDLELTDAPAVTAESDNPLNAFAPAKVVSIYPA